MKSSEGNGSRSAVAATEREQAVIEAARAFVATTSYFQQPKHARETFERLAFALLDLKKPVGRG